MKDQVYQYFFTKLGVTTSENVTKEEKDYLDSLKIMFRTSGGNLTVEHLHLFRLSNIIPQEDYDSVESSWSNALQLEEMEQREIEMSSSIEEGSYSFGGPWDLEETSSDSKFYERCLHFVQDLKLRSRSDCYELVRYLHECLEGTAEVRDLEIYNELLADSDCSETELAAFLGLMINIGHLLGAYEQIDLEPECSYDGY